MFLINPLIVWFFCANFQPLDYKLTAGRPDSKYQLVYVLLEFRKLPSVLPCPCGNCNVGQLQCWMQESLLLRCFASIKNIVNLWCPNSSMWTFIKPMFIFYNLLMLSVELDNFKRYCFNYKRTIVSIDSKYQMFIDCLLSS